MEYQRTSDVKTHKFLDTDGELSALTCAEQQLAL